MDMDLHSPGLWGPLVGGGNRDEATALARTNVDWRETDKEHIFTAEIPGNKLNNSSTLARVTFNSSSAENEMSSGENGNASDCTYMWVAGVRKEDVKVEVEDGAVLKISGEKAREATEQEGESWKRVERSYGSFLRRFRLPEGARVDGIRCTLEDGVLRVVVPKDQDQKRRNVRSIDIS
ncbi:hypothetical protein PR202_gb17436 [Eleusine coracana subsp. coracana]|uniref:SHSP domain-containing protein n=1 Tax=Eleusine coracana subsp. coracana TaxID=191504 RepID=A0AAV5F4H5_ELECO|nr:hypothetical protein PR202_gb17436 [Eleusine coracana subsp. coracana]